MADHTLYDAYGSPEAYVEDDGSIYLYSGAPVGWIDQRGNVYAYSGRHLGVLDRGWVRDHRGACVYFTDQAIGGPVRPVRRVRPVRGVRGVRPVRGVPEVPPVRAVPSLDWSELTGASFFRD